MKRGEVSVQIVWCRNWLLNIVFKKNCKIDFVCNSVMNLFPSCISLIRVLNVDIFQVTWSRHLGLWLNTLLCWLRGLTLPKPFLLFFFCDGNIPPLSLSSTSPLLPLLLSSAIILTIMTTATVTCIIDTVSLPVSCK